MGGPGAPLVVVGVDGATLDLIRPWVADGTLPHLGRLCDRGAWGRLRSTIPPATFPAWTSNRCSSVLAGSVAREP